MGCQSHCSVTFERRPAYAAIFELDGDPADVPRAMTAAAESSVAAYCDRAVTHDRQSEARRVAAGYAGLTDPFGGMLGLWAARKIRGG